MAATAPATSLRPTWRHHMSHGDIRIPLWLVSALGIISLQVHLSVLKLPWAGKLFQRVC